MNSKTSTLRLYKSILCSAKTFPSIKRNKIIAEIKLGFRENKDLTDPDKLRDCINLAIDGLSKLSMYSNLPKNSSSWKINLDKEPMPKNRNH